jgi:hypothetical protein
VSPPRRTRKKPRPITRGFCTCAFFITAVKTIVWVGAGGAFVITAVKTIVWVGFGRAFLITGAKTVKMPPWYPDE